MTMVNKIIFSALVFFSFSISLKAQEEIQPLHGNAVLINHVQKYPASSMQKGTSTTAAFLPFYEDFSYFGPYPNALKWENSQSVFVNHTYPVAPPTMGVASFDGLNRYGYPYNNASTSGSYTSDTLTSIPLRLDFTDATLSVSISPSDSVYFSFYYQPRGRGDAPESGDELHLEFYSPSTTLWTTVWSKSGYNPGTDSSFNRVMIPVLDTSYFKDGFQFRFTNLSTLCGAVDHWHIDLVYLNRRPWSTSVWAQHDTIFPDVSFAYDEQTLLKNYMQMPFFQFLGAADMKSNINAFLRTNAKTPPGINISTYYSINDNAGNTVLPQVLCGTDNLYNFKDSGYCKNQILINPSLGSFVYNGGTAFTDSTSYLFKFYVTKHGIDSIQLNDTGYFRQNFNNYFAYDDGTAEGGYGLSAYGGQTSVKYTLNKPDTLRSLDIFFDPVASVSTLQNAPIRLRIWSDNAGKPGTLLFNDSATVPFYNIGSFNSFKRYQLTTPYVFTSATTFHVGVYQQLNIRLAIGYDMNSDTHTNVSYDLNNTFGWQTPTVKGSLMIRPVFGDSSRAVSVKINTREKENVLIYPNPATDEIFVHATDNIKKIVITDLLGNILVEELNVDKKISVSILPNGLFMLTTFNNKGLSSTQKLIIAR